jgi:hypothetical protein
MGLELAAKAMLRTLGAGKAGLLMAQPATAGSQSGLAIAPPLTGEAEMEPVLLQANVNGSSLLAITTAAVVRRALNSTLGDGASEAAIKEALETAMLRASGGEYRVTAVTIKWFGGEPLLYELEIEA